MEEAIAKAKVKYTQTFWSNEELAEAIALAHDLGHTPFGHAGERSLDLLLEGEGGFVYAGWCGGDACEETVKNDTKATIRVLPEDEFLDGRTPEDLTTEVGVELGQ